MNYSAPAIFDYQVRLGRRLMVWSIFSITSGALMQLLGDVFWRGVGIQFLVWGLIDAAIAYAGLRQSQRRQRQGIPLTPALAQSETVKLRRLLGLNTALDVLYVAGGIALMVTLGANDELWRGMGIGIVIQGGFLFVFDLLHLLRLPSAPLVPAQKDV